ncbi:glutamine--fructose-6-phosphate transaminase (isomerizing) [Candidatus Planktophila dulcis]|uniref:glutamine--fructose-6-phosphate transaminase (isomerizing) n=1 Tax=Candidatus Planktophila dulcis TaxID=1884914 RepID=UPI003CF802C4
MCGIVGYTGPQSAFTPIVEGLRRLEYRGYDSAGIALGTGSSLFVEKRAGKLANLEGALPANLPTVHSGIGHTRWATHGGPTDRNAHPHLDNEGKLAVIHNGIIENYSELKAELEKRGHKFESETDTESVAHLLSELRKEYKGDLTAAMRAAVKRLRGSFTLLAIHADAPQTIVGVRRNSPLVAGLGDGENFLASDVAAFIDYTKRAVELGQDEVVTINPDGIAICDLDGKALALKEYEITWDAAAAQKGGFAHFMLKEIFDQPKAIADTLIGRLSDNNQIQLDELHMSDDEIKKIKRISVIACGTAYHAGMVAKYAIEKWAKVPVDVEIASEYRYRDPIVDKDSLVIAISQSGETMDLLMAVRHAKAAGARVLAVCNTNSSTIPRESDAVLYTHAGPEIAVASTKAFLTQIVAVYLIGLKLAQVRGTLTDAQVKSLYTEMLELPGQVEQILETIEPLRELTRKFAKDNTVLFLGRGIEYPVALEGALKLKELAYIHAEGFAGGELKHGPIALIEEGTAVIAILPTKDEHALDEKMLSNIQEVKARGARVIVIAPEGAEVIGAEHIIRIPVASPLFQPVLATVPLQVFAYEIAVARGNDVDQPRNLAKSVTVE